MTVSLMSQPKWFQLLHLTNIHTQIEKETQIKHQRLFRLQYLMMTLSDSRGIKGQSQRMEFSPHLGRQPEPVVDEEAAGAATARRGSGEAAAEQRDDNGGG
jgi:hypothetical protein